MCKTNLRQHSFSLVEALLAMTILGVAISGILTTFSAAMIATKLSQDYALVSNLMGELRTQLRADLLDPTMINEGNFAGYPDYSWQVNFFYTEVENLYQVELQIQWQRGNRPHRVQYVTYHYVPAPMEEPIS